ncbi:MAG TPA: ABC transporter ATP-binding protein [Vicinamibacterales bacterium]|nr:ABC transporter ATP-binding protein [Vicinamibacterales bacterium]
MIEVRDVTKRYGGLVAVNHANFTVMPGEVLGYLGPNGSGKSTTVKMLVGLMPPSHGSVLYDGVDIQEDLIGYKAQVGYVPEEAHVYTYLTGPEYLRLVGRLRGIPADRLESKINRFLALFGLDTDYHAPLTAYSKGMRQKILLSAALLHNPRVVVLDEPASGLDVSTALVLRTVVKTLAAEQRIIFYSSHELETIEKISTRVIILRSGRIVADDSAARLRELMHLPSLEDVFAQLAVKDNLQQIADGLMTAIRA